VAVERKTCGAYIAPQPGLFDGKEGVGPMLMSGSGKAARVHYLAGTFRLLSEGDHVVCAVTGARIPLHELRYWSVERQEPYIDAESSLKAEQRDD